MTKTQELKERIYALNPELKELTEGCRIKIWWLDNPDEREADEEAIFSERSMRDNGGVDGKYKQIIEDNVCGTVEILGHPIHLEHILRAIEKKNIDGNLLQIDNYGNITYFEESFDDMPKQIKYDPTKSFDQNCENPELVDFLLEVIEPKGSFAVWTPEIKEHANQVKEIIENREKHEHVSDGLIYTSNPPQSRCKDCGEFYK